MTQILQRLKQLVSAVIPLLAIFAQRFADYLLKLSGNMRDVTRERWRLDFQDRSHHLCWCVAGERRNPRYNFVKNYAETPDIRALINLRAARLLRRHITGGSQILIPDSS